MQCFAGRFVLLVFLSFAVGLTGFAQTGDADGDGIEDQYDECRTAAEDWDQFEDSDGCPDVDNDRDGFEDAIDRCPNDPEDGVGDSPTDGCPVVDVIEATQPSLDPFEDLARSFVKLLADPAEQYLDLLLPNGSEVQWIIDNNIEAQYRAEYADWYSDAARVRSDIIATVADFDNLLFQRRRFMMETPVVPLADVAYGGHDVEIADQISQADGTSHLVTVYLSFPFEGFGELRFAAVLQAAKTADRAALVGYHLFDGIELLYPWNQQTPAWDDYVQSMVEVIRRRDREALLRDLAPSKDDRRWWVANRTPPANRDDYLADLEDDSHDENLVVSIEELFAQVYEAMPDAAHLQLVRYASMSTEYGGEEGVMLEVRTPSVNAAVFSISGMQGPDKYYYTPHGTSVTTDAVDMEDDAWVLSFSLYAPPEQSMAERDKRSRERARMIAACPGWEESLRVARRSLKIGTRAARATIAGGDVVIGCAHAHELLGDGYLRVLRRRGEAFLSWAANEDGSLSEDSVATLTMEGIEAYLSALQFVEQSETTSEASARRTSRAISEVVVAATRSMYESGVAAQRSRRDEAAVRFLTAAAVGSVLLDPEDAVDRQIRSYAGYVAGGTALNAGRVAEARRFLPLVVPPDRALLEVSGAALSDALFLDDEESANLYFNLGAIAFNQAWAEYENQSQSAEPDYTDIAALLEEARVSLALAIRLDPSRTDAEAAAVEVEKLATTIGEQ